MGRMGGVVHEMFWRHGVVAAKVVVAAVNSDGLIGEGDDEVGRWQVARSLFQKSMCAR